MNVRIASEESKTINALASGLSYLHKCAEKLWRLRGQSNGQPDVVSVSRRMWLATAAVIAGTMSKSRGGYRERRVYEKQTQAAMVKIECEIPLLW
jgi:hypothetical protein